MVVFILVFITNRYFINVINLYYHLLHMKKIVNVKFCNSILKFNCSRAVDAQTEKSSQKNILIDMSQAQ